MHTLARQLLQWWIDAWRGDPFESDLAMQGEHRVARSRVLIVASLALLNVLIVVADPGNRDFADALLINLCGLAGAFLVLLYTRRGNKPTLLQAVTVVGDITMVSVLHVLDLLQGLPSVVLNGRVTFTLYFFAMVGTIIRFNPRLAILGGLTSALQYGAIALWAIRIWPTTLTEDIIQHGTYDWGVQVEKTVTMLIFGGVCWSIAAWVLELRSSATHDMLTGLYNRRTFEEQFHSELLRSQRTGDRLAMAMIDIDHFKRVNDTWGHHAGDLVLQSVATLLRSTVRRTDLLGRWGGEEFALAFRADSLDAAGLHLERLRAVLEATPVALPTGDRLRLTFSAGLAYSPQDGSDGAHLTLVADARLLEAKRAGRNRIIIADRTLIAV